VCPPLTCKWFGPLATVADVVDWVMLKLRDGRALSGRFPRGLDNVVADRYEEWLAAKVV
jgi:hypothetical protein